MSEPVGLASALVAAFVVALAWFAQGAVAPARAGLLRVAGRCPAGLRGRVARELARAGLDARWSAEAWLARHASGVVVGLLLLPLAWATGLLAVAPILWLAPLAAAAVPALRLRARAARRAVQLEREVPTWLELLALGLEAGTAFPAALQRSVARVPAGPLREECLRLVHELRAGRPRREALQRLARRLELPALTALVAALAQAEASGLSLAPVLRAQARRGTQERFARAEKRALEAPVKMLGPLVLCIFPCTFIVIGFPIAAVLLWGG